MAGGVTERLGGCQPRLTKRRPVLKTAEVPSASEAATGLFLKPGDSGVDTSRKWRSGVGHRAGGCREDPGARGRGLARPHLTASVAWGYNLDNEKHPKFYLEPLTGLHILLKALCMNTQDAHSN